MNRNKQDMNRILNWIQLGGYFLDYVGYFWNGGGGNVGGWYLLY